MINKELILLDFVKNLENAWTYTKLTNTEKNKFIDLIETGIFSENIKGTYNQKWNILDNMYNAYIIGLGYDGYNWRSNNEER